MGVDYASVSGLLRTTHHFTMYTAIHPQVPSESLLVLLSFERNTALLHFALPGC